MEGGRESWILKSERGNGILGEDWREECLFSIALFIVYF